jgi:hypothetical protein
MVSRRNKRRSTKSKCFGCGYFLATIKALKKQVILQNVAEAMSGKCRVIERKTRYPRL